MIQRKIDLARQGFQRAIQLRRRGVGNRAPPEINPELIDKKPATLDQSLDQRGRSTIEATVSFDPEQPGQASHGAALAARDWWLACLQSVNLSVENRSRCAV
jgi:hypothetical protein